MIDSTTQLYGLIGNPVLGSRSPWIHNHVFNTCGIPGVYLTFNVESKALAEAVLGLKALGVKGFNVTMPYKSDIIPLLDGIDPFAKQMGAVNTVVCKGGQFYGHNTDGPGLIAVLWRQVPELEQKKILVLGAGGASRGICGALASIKGIMLGIWNRSSDKAVQLAAELDHGKSEGCTVASVCSENAFADYDVVINTTSVGMAPETEHTPININLLKQGAVVCDIVYKPHRTLLLREAIHAGYPVIYGIEMLIEQALLAQKLWNDLKDDQLFEIREALMKDFEGFHK